MYCLKCGQETENERVFCDHCLEVMDRYPIKSDAPLQLPRRKTSAASKKANRRREITTEELLRRLRVLVRVQTVCLVLALALAAFFGWLHFFRQEPAPQVEPELPIGQNYTVDATNET